MKQNKLPVVATLQICGSLLLNIYGIEHGINDRVIAGYIEETPRKHKIYYTTKGKSYFRKHGQRFYIDDFMRVAW